MSTISLRDYQRDAVDAVVGAWDRGVRRPAIVLPTGAGKTVVFAHLAIEWLGRNPGGRVLVVAHRVELIEQAVRKFHDVAPDLPVGVVMANRNETRARVVVGSVQTLRSESRRSMIADVGLVIIDEAHHATAASYRALLTHYGCFDRGAVAFGCTATMVRGDDTSLGDVWQEIVFTRSIGFMIERGWLVRPKGIHVKVDSLDMTGVRKSGGDYREADLGAAIENSLAPEAIAKAIIEHAPDDPGFIFAPTVASAEVIGEAVSAAGVETVLIHGAMHPDERRAAWAAFDAGDAQYVTNCMVATEGTDKPKVRTVVLARPTLNPGLFVQMVGRGLRPFPGKTGALVLDVVGATRRHDLNTKIDLFGEKDVNEKTDKEETEEEFDILAELEPEFEGDSGSDLDMGVDGPLVSTEVDLFAGSNSAWLQTRAGTWFLPAGERYIAVVRDGLGGYDVVAMHRYQHPSGVWVARHVSDVSYAMRHAEEEITPAEMMTAQKARSWRAKKPSDAQKDLARRYGIVVHDSMRSGETSNLITVAMATGRIDPHTPEWRKMS